MCYMKPGASFFFLHLMAAEGFGEVETGENVTFVTSLKEFTQNLQFCYGSSPWPYCSHLTIVLAHNGMKKYCKMVCTFNLETQTTYACREEGEFPADIVCFHLHSGV